MALAVLGVGAAGVVGMQRTTILGNVRARNLATANAIAATWSERLRADAKLWTQTAVGTSTISSTRWLSAVGTSFPGMDSTEGVWFKPTAVAAEDIYSAADVFGRDIDPSAAPDEVGFCTHLRVTQVLPRVIRAEVRVLWLRHGGGGILNTTGGLCDVDPTAAGGAPERYHFVYLTTSILRQG